MPVFVGMLTLDLLLGDVHSLKQKRAVIRPILADLDRRAGVCAAEVEWQDLHRRAKIGVAVIGGTAGRVGDLLRDCEDGVARRPEVELLATRSRVYSDKDDD
jgi:uncharacterized protein YlxP (DUF503 family)